MIDPNFHLFIGGSGPLPCSLLSVLEIVFVLLPSAARCSGCAPASAVHQGCSRPGRTEARVRVCDAVLGGGCGGSLLLTLLPWPPSGHWIWLEVHWDQPTSFLFAVSVLMNAVVHNTNFIDMFRFFMNFVSLFELPMFSWAVDQLGLL